MSWNAVCYESWRSLFGQLHGFRSPSFRHAPGHPWLAYCSRPLLSLSMIILFLLIELVFAVFEGGYFWVTLTVAAVASVYLSFSGGQQSLRAMQAIWKRAKEEGQTTKLTWRKQANSSAAFVLDPMFVEAVVFLHVIAIPPWYAFFIVDDFFIVGLYVVSFLALVVRVANSRTKRLSETNAESLER